MKRNWIYLTTTFLIALAGLLFKKMDIIGAGTIMGLGFLIIITLSTILFYKTFPKNILSVIFWLLQIILPVLLFALIQNRHFSEILGAATIWTICVLILTILINWIKNKLQTPKMHVN